MKHTVPRTPFSTPLSRSARGTEERIRNLFQGKRKRPALLLMLAVLAVIALCGSLVAFQPETQPEGAAPPATLPESPLPTPTASPNPSDNPPEPGSLEALYSLTAADSGDTDAVRAIAQAWLDFYIRLSFDPATNTSFILDSRIDGLDLMWQSNEFAVYQFDFFFLTQDPETISDPFYPPLLADGGWYRPQTGTPYLILRDGAYYSEVYSYTFLPSSRAALPVADSPKEALRAVLLEEAQFVSVLRSAHNQPQNISEIYRLFFPEEEARQMVEARTRDFWVSPPDFTVADLDRDGTPEVILSADIAPFLILHYEAGTVYGYEAYTRWFIPLKADGTIHGSGSAASYGYGFMTFMGDDVLTYSETYCNPRFGDWNDMTYFVNRKAASQAEFEAAYAQLDAKPDAVWHPLTPENIELALSGSI